MTKRKFISEKDYYFDAISLIDHDQELAKGMLLFLKDNGRTDYANFSAYQLKSMQDVRAKTPEDNVELGSSFRAFIKRANYKYGLLSFIDVAILISAAFYALYRIRSQWEISRELDLGYSFCFIFCFFSIAIFWVDYSKEKLNQTNSK